MYTRSFPSRRMPPDYGGTALVVKNSDDNIQKTALTVEPPTDKRLRRALMSAPEPSETPDFQAPFGINGQEDARLESSKNIDPQNVPTVSFDTENQELSSRKQSFFDPETLKSDDLLILGIALMLLYDKNKDENIPLDALLILAMLYLSGL